MKTRSRLLAGQMLLLALGQNAWAATAPLTNAPPSLVTDPALRTVGLGAAAALAITVSVCGAAYAVARIGSAALGTAAEKPELLTRSLVFVALAEGLAVLGFAIAAMLIQKI